MTEIKMATTPLAEVKEKKKKFRIALCTHAFEHIDYSAHYNHLYCAAKWAQQYDLRFIGKKGLDAAGARNQITDLAIKEDCTHMFFMDADHLFPSDTLPLLMENHDEAMTSGMVCKKGEGFPQVLWMVNGEGKDRKYVAHEFPLDGSVYQVGICAFGCTLINLEMLKKLDKPYFQDTCDTPSGKEPNNVRSDINICNKFREQLKEKIFVDTRVLIGHIGAPSIIYPQNAKIQHDLLSTINDTRTLREGQQGFWFDPIC